MKNDLFFPVLIMALLFINSCSLMQGHKRIQSIEKKVDVTINQVRVLGGFQGYKWHLRQCGVCGYDKPEPKGSTYIDGPNGEKFICERCLFNLDD